MMHTCAVCIRAASTLHWCALRLRLTIICLPAGTYVVLTWSVDHLIGTVDIHCRGAVCQSRCAVFRCWGCTAAEVWHRWRQNAVISKAAGRTFASRAKCQCVCLSAVSLFVTCIYKMHIRPFERFGNPPHKVTTFSVWRQGCKTTGEFGVNKSMECDTFYLQCFDTIGLATGRASSL